MVATRNPNIRINSSPLGGSPRRRKPTPRTSSHSDSKAIAKARRRARNFPSSKASRYIGCARIRLKVRWLNSAFTASKPNAIAMTGATSPTVSMNENGIGSGAIVSSRRNRNGLWPIDSRIVVVENQANTSAIRKTSASITTIRAPLSWSAASLARTIPAPVKGEPLRRMAHLVEIAGIDLVEARLGKADAGQLGRRSEQPGNLRPQIALAIDPIKLRPEYLHPDHARHAGEPVADAGAADLDIDNMAAAENPLCEVGYAARQR